MNKYGSKIVLKILNLYITQDMQMTYLPYFVHSIILKNKLFKFETYQFEIHLWERK